MLSACIFVSSLSEPACLSHLPSPCRRVIIYKCSDPAKFLLNPDAAPWVGKVNLEYHTARVWCVSFSPDGKFVVSGAWDGTVNVYPCWVFDQRDKSNSEEEAPSNPFEDVEEMHMTTLQCFANVWTAVFQPAITNQAYSVLATGAADHKVGMRCGATPFPQLPFVHPLFDSEDFA